MIRPDHVLLDYDYINGYYIFPKLNRKVNAVGINAALNIVLPTWIKVQHHVMLNKCLVFYLKEKDFLLLKTFGESYVDWDYTNTVCNEALEWASDVRNRR